MQPAAAHQTTRACVFFGEMSVWFDNWADKKKCAEKLLGEFSLCGLYLSAITCPRHVQGALGLTPAKGDLRRNCQCLPVSPTEPLCIECRLRLVSCTTSQDASLDAAIGVLNRATRW